MKPRKPGIHGISANKRTEAQKLLDARLFEDMAIEGATLAQMADEIKKRRPYTLSLNQIWHDLRKAKEHWRKEAMEAIDKRVAAELKGLQRQERELWEGWKRSQEHAVEWVNERGKGRKLVRMKETIKPQVGDPQFHALILQVRKQRRELLGMDKPSEVELTGKGGGPVDHKLVIEMINVKEGDLPR